MHEVLDQVRSAAGRSARAAGEAGALVGGRALAAVFGAAAKVRRSRPLHPRGVTYAATIEMSGTAASGVPWLDEAGSTPAQVRVSRAVGLPERLPDIYGVGLRVQVSRTGQPMAQVDLLFASTGDGVVDRFVLEPRLALARGPVTTLLPVRSPSGALLLRLSLAEGTSVTDRGVPHEMVLSYAVGTGAWVPTGRLVLGEPLTAVDEERRDPVVHELPGTEQYDAVRRLREPAYRAARRIRPQV